MKEIYWLTRLDNLYSCLTATMIIAIMAIMLLLFATINAKLEREESWFKPLKKWCIFSFVMLVLSAIGLVFVPTTKEALTILGIGGTIEYVQDNETLKELPDKCVKALDMWVDSLSEEE